MLTLQASGFLQQWLCGCEFTHFHFRDTPLSRRIKRMPRLLEIALFLRFVVLVWIQNIECSLYTCENWIVLCTVHATKLNTGRTYFLLHFRVGWGKYSSKKFIEFDNTIKAGPAPVWHHFSKWNKSKHVKKLFLFPIHPELDCVNWWYVIDCYLGYSILLSFYTSILRDFISCQLGIELAFHHCILHGCFLE